MLSVRSMCLRGLACASIASCGLPPGGSEGTTEDVDSGSTSASGGSISTSAMSSTVGDTEPTQSTGLPGSSSESTGAVCVPEGLSPACSVLCQDCGQGEKCGLLSLYDETSFFFDEAVVGCMPLDDDSLPIGESCDPDREGNSDECIGGGFCGPFSGSYACDELCVPPFAEFECSLADARCLPTSESETSHGYAVCMRACDPLDEGDCVEFGNQVCQPRNPDCDATVDPDCYPVRAGSFVCSVSAKGLYRDHGEPCTVEHDCTDPSDRNAVCVPASLVPNCESERCCSSLCDLTDEPSTCPLSGEGEVCTPYFAEGDAPDGLEHVGICRIR